MFSVDTSHLKTADFSDMHITDDDVPGLIIAADVRVVNLSHNHIRDRGAKALAKMLGNRPMLWLDVSYNDIGDDGAVALASICTAGRVVVMNYNLMTTVGYGEVNAAIDALDSSGTFYWKGNPGVYGWRFFWGALTGIWPKREIKHD